MPDIDFSDEELVAYLDGEAEHAPVEDIAKALRTDMALAKRTEALRVDTNKIAKSFNAFLNTDNIAPFVLDAPAERGWKSSAIAASLLAVLLGFGAGYQFSRPAERDWKDYVAAYQFLYTTNTLRSVQSSGDLQQRDLDRVGAAIGKEISVAKLTDFPEMEYKRAQVLGYRGQALAQLTFLSSTGEPIALCILRADSPADQALKISEMEGMSAVDWKSGGYDYLLIGGQNTSLLKRMATNFLSKTL